MNFPEIDEALLRRLLEDARPDLAGAALRAVPSAGTDNALFRVGDDLVARLPRASWAVAQPAREHRWLPRLAPALPIAIPEPVALCAPVEPYPCEWSLHRWLPGESSAAATFGDPVREAARLGSFLRALRAIDATGGPAAGPDNNGRGAPLGTRDGVVRRAVAALAALPGAKVDDAAALAAWERDASRSTWRAAPVWVHGDVHDGNLLLQDGAISAVIDFGTFGVGDPAVDLLPAWNLFDGPAREAFRVAMALDDDAWARGRAWALSVALIALPYYMDSNPVIVAQSRAVIGALLAEHSGG